MCSVASCALRSSLVCAKATLSGLVTKILPFISVAALLASSDDEKETKPNPATIQNRAVFKWLSKEITWFRLLRLVIGLKGSRQFFNQWDAKPNPIAPCTRDFSRALSEIQIIATNRDWFVALPAPVLWLVGLIALVLVFQQSFENSSNKWVRKLIKFAWRQKAWFIQTWDLSVQVLFKDKSHFFKGFFFHSISHTGYM